MTGRRRHQIRADLKLLSAYTHTIRTYSSTGGVELVPAIAAEFGLKVTLGIWIDKNEARNEREIQAAIALARRHSNINAIVVGNETTLRLDLLRKGSHVPGAAGQDRRRAQGRAQRRGTDQAHSTREADEPGAGDHRRDLDGLDRSSAARLGGRFHCRPYPALLGRLSRRSGGRQDHRVLQQAAAHASRQAHRGRRVRLAERRLQHAEGESRPHRTGSGAARFRLARRGLRDRLQHHRGLRSAVEDQ